MKKIIRICLRVLLLLSGVICLGMDMLSAAGWSYNYRQGNYPDIFSVYSFWMYLGTGLMIVSVLLVCIAIKPKFYILNSIAIGFVIIGCIACMKVLSAFCAYADQNFSGIGEDMQMVSDLYSDRILPTLLPVCLVIILAVWQWMDSSAYRIEKRQKKLAEQNAEAPKILD